MCSMPGGCRRQRLCSRLLMLGSCGAAASLARRSSSVAGREQPVLWLQLRLNKAQLCWWQQVHLQVLSSRDLCTRTGPSLQYPMLRYGAFAILQIQLRTSAW